LLSGVAGGRRKVRPGKNKEEIPLLRKRKKTPSDEKRKGIGKRCHLPYSPRRGEAPSLPQGNFPFLHSKEGDFTAKDGGRRNFQFLRKSPYQLKGTPKKKINELDRPGGKERNRHLPPWGKDDKGITTRRT